VNDGIAETVAKLPSCCGGHRAMARHTSAHVAKLPRGYSPPRAPAAQPRKHPITLAGMPPTCPQIVRPDAHRLAPPQLDRDAARRFVPRDEQRADSTALTVFAGMSTFA